MQEIAAGQEFELTMELPWYNADLTKDFSVVTYAEKEQVSLRHADGLESDHWPAQGAIEEEEEEETPEEEEEVIADYTELQSILD